MIRNKQSEQNECSLFQKRVSMAVSLLLVATVMLSLYAAIQAISKGYVQIFGFSMFRVVTGSMEPEIPVGALLLTKASDIEKIALRDVVCFRTQDSAIWGRVVTHRVVEILQMDGEILLRTQGDANLAADGYLVDRYTLIGKVIWHTGDDSMLAGIFSFFTNKVGFLGCIVLPCLLLSGLLLKNCVSNIRNEMRQAMHEMQQPADRPEITADPLAGMSQEEYNEMCERIRAELTEELMHCAPNSEQAD